MFRWNASPNSSATLPTVPRVLKIGDVQWDDSHKVLRVVMRADPVNVATLRITREALSSLQSTPEHERIPLTMYLEHFAQGRAAEWGDVKVDEAKAVQQWAFGDALLRIEEKPPAEITPVPSA